MCCEKCRLADSTHLRSGTPSHHRQHKWKGWPLSLDTARFPCEGALDNRTPPLAGDTAETPRFIETLPPAGLPLHRRGGPGHARDGFTGGASASKLLRRSGTGIFCRWNDRGVNHRAGAHSRAAGSLADFCCALQGKPENGSGDRQGTWRPGDPRGSGGARGRAGTNQRQADPASPWIPVRPTGTTGMRTISWPRVIAPARGRLKAGCSQDWLPHKRVGLRPHYTRCRRRRGGGRRSGPGGRRLPSPAERFRRARVGAAARLAAVAPNPPGRRGRRRR